mgnify:CR=1 FL=1
MLIFFLFTRKVGESEKAVCYVREVIIRQALVKQVVSD